LYSNSPSLNVIQSFSYSLGFSFLLFESFYGQAKPEKKDLEALAKSLDIRQQYLDEALGESFWPDRGLGEMPPRGECIICHQLVQVKSC